MTTRIGVITFPGSLDDGDAQRAIRLAGAEDAAAVAPLFDAYRQFYDQPSDLRRARNWLRARIGNNESVVLLAERDGAAIVSYAGL